MTTAVLVARGRARRSLRVLSVAFPFAPVGPATAGGAEQILSSLDRALTERGHRSIVIAQRGSSVYGSLVSLPVFDPIREREAAWREWRAAIERTLRREKVDVVHAHGLDAHAYAPDRTLWTLHLPPALYPPQIWELRATLTCVSDTQRRACPPGAVISRTIANGVHLDELEPRTRKDDYVVVLGRVCEEKGFHLAIEAAERARVPLVLAGRVFDYPAHRAYFETSVRPRLGPRCRFVGPVGPPARRALLAGARALIVSSTIDETSSLVAMEALASATPVVAFARGALPELVEHGRTGLLVSDVEAMADAIRRIDAIDPAVCRSAAEARFCATRMHDEYLALYRELADGGRVPPPELVVGAARSVATGTPVAG